MAFLNAHLYWTIYRKLQCLLVLLHYHGLPASSASNQILSCGKLADLLKPLTSPYILQQTRLIPGSIAQSNTASSWLAKRSQGDSIGALRGLVQQHLSKNYKGPGRNLITSPWFILPNQHFNAVPKIMHPLSEGKN